MEVLSEAWIDKSSWGDGPWLEEPDRVEWRDDKTGLPCLMLRHPHGGHWCGYVGVPPGHPWHGRHYDDVDVEAHGGLTFAQSCMEDARPQRERVCHVPLSGESDEVYWFGFDCAHASDLSPGMAARDLAIGFPPLRDQVYRPAVYVRAECTTLAQALAEAS